MHGQGGLPVAAKNDQVAAVTRFERASVPTQPPLELARRHGHEAHSLTTPVVICNKCDASIRVHLCSSTLRAGGHAGCRLVRDGGELLARQVPFGAATVLLLGIALLRQLRCLAGGSVRDPEGPNEGCGLSS